MVSTPLKNISQHGNLPQIGVKIRNIWNHHLVFFGRCFRTEPFCISPRNTWKTIQLNSQDTSPAPSVVIRLFPRLVLLSDWVVGKLKLWSGRVFFWFKCAGDRYPYHPCMVYLPTFGDFLWSLIVVKYAIHGCYGVYFSGWSSETECASPTSNLSLDYVPLWKNYPLQNRWRHVMPIFDASSYIANPFFSAFTRRQLFIYSPTQ